MFLTLHLVRRSRSLTNLEGTGFTIWSLPSNSSNSVLASYSGQSFTTNPPIIISTSNHIQGSVLGINSYLGTPNSVLIANYYGSNCINSCSGNGYCRNGICDCYSGWEGESCNQSMVFLLIIPNCMSASCGMNCSGNGVCDKSTNQCICYPGYYGPECTTTDCSGLSVLTSKTGAITDHIIGSQYLPNQFCQWLLKPEATTDQPISFTFTKFQLENVDDRITVYDGDNVNAPVLLDASGIGVYYLNNCLRLMVSFSNQIKCWCNACGISNRSLQNTVFRFCSQFLY
jgi:hypothetical protein